MTAKKTLRTSAKARYHVAPCFSMLHQLRQHHGIVILEVVGLFSMTQYDSVQACRHAQDADKNILGIGMFAEHGCHKHPFSTRCMINRGVALNKDR